MVERRLKDALRHDRARIQVGRISHFGLLEMSRQRLRTGVLEGSTTQCPHCQGTGIIRSIESVALAVLRALEDRLITDGAVPLVATTRVDVALYILNNKRAHLNDIEQRYRIPITVTADENMHVSQFVIERRRRGRDRQWRRERWCRWTGPIMTRPQPLRLGAPAPPSQPKRKAEQKGRRSRRRRRKAAVRAAAKDTAAAAQPRLMLMPSRRHEDEEEHDEREESGAESAGRSPGAPKRSALRMAARTAGLAAEGGVAAGVGEAVSVRKAASGRVRRAATPPEARRTWR